MRDSHLRCVELSKSYAGIQAVDRASFQVGKGELLTLLGPSGCGKTTILRLIAGFEKLDHGKIEIGGAEIASTNYHLPPEKRRVGMVFQDYAIFPHMTVGKNVRFGVGKGKGAEQKVTEMLALVGLDGLADRMPHELSGGQQQRVALARALAPNPAVLLLDEPFSNLDASLRTQVRIEVRDLLKRSGATAIFVTHDQEEALYLGDKLGVMEAGKVVQVGDPESVFHQPISKFVAEFLGDTDFIAGTIGTSGVETPLGILPQNIEGNAGDKVEIAIRSDDIMLTPSENDEGNVRILSRRFVGVATIYALALSDGSIVHSFQPHTIHFAEGESAIASFRPGHTLPCFPA